MKVTILDLPPGEEAELVIKCDHLNEDLTKLINSFKQGNSTLTGYQNGSIHLLCPKDIYYFESVDQHTYAYCEKEVFEIKSRLYELEAELPALDFFRSSKSTILNLNKIKSLSPAFGSRFEALLKNGERVIISRQYVSVLKEKLGL